MTLSLISVLGFIGVVAFAISGAVLAIKKGMDIFGVNILAVIAALGGGLTRDIIIDVAPPAIFQSPISVTLAIFVANVAFLIAYFHKDIDDKLATFYDKGMFWIDTLGLAAFVVDGVSACMNTVHRDNLFLVVFVGAITGVGGGVLRDVLANELPVIFVKHIYASAAVVGALITALIWDKLGANLSMTIGFFVVMSVRIIAAHYNLNLPRIERKTRNEENLA